MKLTYRQLCRLFIDFLKKNDALKAYKKNALKDGRYRNTVINYINPLTKKNICHAFNYKEYDELINYAFYWAKTKEGDSYWRELSAKWTQFIFENKIELIQEKINN